MREQFDTLYKLGLQRWSIFKTEGCYRAEDLQENIFLGGLIAHKFKISGSLLISFLIL